VRFHSHNGSARKTLCTVKTAALIVSLPLGAWLMAAVAGPTRQAWLGWFSLLPLFFAIRYWRPTAATLGGGLWGLAVYVFSVSRPEAGVPASFGALLLTTAIPAFYAAGGAWLTRWIGFNPFVLGVGWMGVELALAPTGLSAAVLGPVVGEGTLLHWVSKTLGYVLAGFLVALVNASVVLVLSGVQLALPPLRHRAPSADGGGSGHRPAFFFPSRFAIRLLQPRAPPTSL